MSDISAQETNNHEASECSIKRRDFLAGSAAAAAFTVVPAHVLAGSDEASPSDKLNIAGIGLGSMGWNDMQRSCIKKENVVALCDVNEKHLARASETYSKAETYLDWRRCRDQKNIDAVYCATPDHIHAFIATWAMNRDLHVYCQKPLARTVEEARVVRETYLEKKDKLATQLGTQMHANPNVRRFVELVRGGIVGTPREAWVWCSREPRDEVKKGHYLPNRNPAPDHLHWDRWVGPSPYHPFNPNYLGGGCLKWNWFWDFGAGQIGDMGSHMMDIAHWALDLDISTSCAATGSPLKNDMCPLWLKATWKHPANDWRPEMKVHWLDGGKKPDVPAKKLFKAVVVKGDKGYIIADYGNRRIEPLNGKRPKDPSKISKDLVPSSSGPIDHYKEWVQACKTDKSTLSNFDYAGKVIENNMLALTAYRTGRRLEWDSEKMEATNYPAAEKYLRYSQGPGPTYRRGWKLNG